MFSERWCWRWWLALCCCLATGGLRAAEKPVRGTETAPLSNRGTEFWAGMPPNDGGEASYELVIVGAGSFDWALYEGDDETPFDSGSTGGRAGAGPVSVTVDLGGSAAGKGLWIGLAAVRLETSEPVQVYGVSLAADSGGACTVLPTASLGTEYMVLAESNHQGQLGSEVSIVATEKDTAVTITLLDGTTYTPTLQPGDIYVLQNEDAGGDVTGTTIVADKKVAVFAGHREAADRAGLTTTAYSGPDYVVEQLPPAAQAGYRFCFAPFGDHEGTSWLRVLALADDTTVYMYGSLNYRPGFWPTVDRGQVADLEVPGNGMLWADKPLLVAQICRGSVDPTLNGDPAMMLLPPISQYLETYTFRTPDTSSEGSFPVNWLTIICPKTATTSVYLDDAVAQTDPTQWIDIPDTEWAETKLPISADHHTLSSDVPFAAWAYGRNDGARTRETGNWSYAYPVGMGCSPQALVDDAHVTALPETQSPLIGLESLVTVTVGDVNGNPLAGVAVDIVVTGANPQQMTYYTDSTGVVEFRWQGTAAGTDEWTVTIGAITRHGSSSFNTGGDSIEVSLADGWNLVGMPFAPDTYTPQSLFGADSFTMELIKGTGDPSRYQGIAYSYQFVSRVEAFHAYWVWVPTARTVTISGTYLSERRIALTVGWNTIAVDAAVDWASLSAANPYLRAAVSYDAGGEGAGYQTVTAYLLPDGTGYFVFVQQPYTLVLAEVDR